jgi:hypothetical protein
MIGAPPLRQPAAQMRAPAEPIADGNVMLETQPQAHVTPMHAQPSLPARGTSVFAQKAGAGLFADARPTAAPAALPQTAEPARSSLFTTVTGAFRRRPAAPAAVETAMPRHEPVLHGEQRAEAPRASVRLASASEEPTLEIPAFLRRQTS